MYNTPALAYNIIRGETKTIQETWINIGWNRFKWLQSRPDQSVKTRNNIVIRACPDKEKPRYDSETKTLWLSEKLQSMVIDIIDTTNVCDAICELLRAWEQYQGISEYNPVRLYYEARRAMITLPRTVKTNDKIEFFITENVNFRTSNGITIHTFRHPRFEYDGRDLFIDLGPIKDLSVIEAILKDLPRVEEALQEFDRCHSINIVKGDIDFTSWTYPGLVNINPESVRPPPSLLMTTELYRFIHKMGNHKFKGSNGIKISCRDDWNPGYENGKLKTLYFNSLICDTPWIPKNNTYGLNNYIRDYPLIKVAFDELTKAYQDSLPLEPVKVAKTEDTEPVLEKSLTPINIFRDNLERLEKMGFGREEAIKALVEVDNDFVKAVSKLI